MGPRKKRHAPSNDDQGSVDSEAEPEWEWTDGIPDINPNPGSLKSYAIQHFSASYCGTHYKVGDLVQIRADARRYRWVGLIRGFEYDTHPKHEKPVERKRAIVMWFCRQGDIKNPKKRRNDAHTVPPRKVAMTNV